MSPVRGAKMKDAVAEERAIPGECPSREVLSDLALGKLPMDAIETLGQHVESCPACQGVLETFDGLEDSVIADIKGQTGPLPPDPQLREQIRQAEQISHIVWGEPSQNAREEPPPARLGQYEVQEKIGQGGMGTVYRAMHTRLKRPVAIKVLPAGRLRDPQAVARFQREMEAVGQLDHPNLVRAHDAGEAEGQHFLVMEFLDGINLAQLVRQSGPLTVVDACETVRQAALGLQYAHEHGLVHRDVKPSNLMLTTDRQIKVLDLGLAKLAEDAAVAGDMTSAGQVLGTGDYIAPEQGENPRQADARADIYSLGCTLYYLLTGQAPFSGPQYATFMQKIMAHAKEPVPPIQTLRSDIPEGVVAILERMLAKAPEGRFQTAAELVDVLTAYAAGSDLKCVAAQRDVRAQGEDRRQGPRRARRSYWSAGVLGLLLTLGLLGYWHRGTIPDRGNSPAPSPALQQIQDAVSPERLKQIQKETDEIVADTQADMKEMDKELENGFRDIDAEQRDADKGPKDSGRQRKPKSLPGRSSATKSAR